ncbi:MAG: SHOCT domain-containing protein [Candidatus Methanofastidiosia archaeon]|jgi:hypothetical protein
MEPTLKSKIVMTVTVILAGICGALVLQAVAIIKYAVFWYFQRTYPGFSSDIEAYVFSKILCVSVLSILAGVFLVITVWAIIAIMKKFTISKVLVVVVAVLVTGVCGIFAVRCMQNVLQQPSFLAGRSDIWNEYQIHISSRVRPTMVFSVLTGGLLAVFFRFLREPFAKMPITESKLKPKMEKPPKVKPTESKTKSLNILKKRLTEGEITEEEYTKMESVLEEE